MSTAEILRTLLDSGQFADLIIKCGDREYKVHKCIVCLRSEWFAAACSEGRWKEGCEGVIELEAIDTTDQTQQPDYSCDDPSAIKFMIDFLYDEDYNLDTYSKDGNLIPKVADKDETPPASTSAQRPPTSLPGISPSPQSEIIDLTLSDDNDIPFFPTHHHHHHPTSNPTLPKGHMTMHAHLFALGGKYGIPSLESLSLARLEGLSENFAIHDEDFADALTVAFESTEHGSALQEFFVGEILERPAVMLQSGRIWGAIKRVEGLGLVLFRRQTLGEVVDFGGVLGGGGDELEVDLEGVGFEVDGEAVMEVVDLSGEIEEGMNEGGGEDDDDDDDEEEEEEDVDEFELSSEDGSEEEQFEEHENLNGAGV